MDSVHINHHLTFASHWINEPLLSHIEQTIIRPNGRRFLTANQVDLKMIGIHFRPAFQSGVDIGLTITSNVNFELSNCWVEGVFDSIRNFSNAVFLDTTLQGMSSFQILSSKFDGDNLGPTQWFRGYRSRFYVDDSRFLRSASLNFIIPCIRGWGDTLKVVRSNFDVSGAVLNYGGYIQVDSSTFNHSGSYTILAMSSANQNGLSIRTTNFSNLFQNQLYSTIYSQNSPVLIEDCSFSQGIGNFESSLIRSTSSIVIRNSQFIGISGYLNLVSTGNGSIDSSTFEFCNSPLIGNSNVFTNWSVIHSDFLYCLEFDSRIQGNIIPFINAPNCYWGDPSGPNHPQNPSGLGLVLNSNTNPFPFRAAPINTNICDPHDISWENNLQPKNWVKYYPNPVNGTIQISILLNELPLEASLYDRQGRWMKNYNFYTSKVNLDLSSFSSGSYFLRFHSKTKHQTLQFVIMK